METLILQDPRYLLHDPGPGHPEHAGRLQRVYRELAAKPISGTRVIRPRAATRHEIEAVHSPEYFARVVATRDQASFAFDADTRTCADSYAATIHASGAALLGVERVCAQEARHAFALIRPPGHHAEQDSALGFCLFNHVAVAAAFARRELGLERILILDPDVHHGNGTQRSFFDSAEVLYVSSHRFPFYPGTGWFSEIGSGRGEGHTVNLPHPAGMSDADLLHLYQSVVDPIVQVFQPQLILVSAGFDTWHSDPLGGMQVTEAGMRALFSLFREWAEAYCPGRIVAALEGGYDPAGLAEGVRAALEVLSGEADPSQPIRIPVSQSTREIVQRARQTLAPYWSSLRMS